MSIRVLHILGSLEQGGSESQAVQLVKFLRASASVEVDVACLSKRGILASELAASGYEDIPAYPLRSFYDGNFVRQVSKCTRFIKERQFDIVQTHDFYSNVFGITAARLAGVRLAIAAKCETSGMRTKAQDLVEKVIFGLADKIVVNAHAVQQYLVNKRVPENKLELIYNGVDVGRFDLTTTSAPAYAEDSLTQSVRPGTKLVTLVANLRHHVKNHTLLLKAAQALSGRFQDVDFVLAGEGDLTKELMSMSKDLGIQDRVHFVGQCQSIPGLLSRSFVGVLTSKAEGFPNAILEYMAAGLPVVSTDVGGVREAVIPGETGFLVSNDNVGELTEKLSLLIENPKIAAAMGAKGRDVIIQKFSCEVQVKDTLAMYGSVSKPTLCAAEAQRANT